MSIIIYLPSWNTNAPSTNSSSSTLCDVALLTNIVKLEPLEVTACLTRNLPEGSLASLTVWPQTRKSALSPLSNLSPLSPLPPNSWSPSKISIWDLQLCNLVMIKYKKILFLFVLMYFTKFVEEKSWYFLNVVYLIYKG